MPSDADLPLLEDDLDEIGVIQAAALHRPLDISPIAVLCFFNDLLDRLVSQNQLTEVHALRSEIGRNPVYQLDIDNRTVLVVHPGVGAPLAAGFLEETLALGVTTVVACGGAGALRAEHDLGRVMVVNSAVRDEGTSFHYARPSRVQVADPRAVAIVSESLTANGVEHIVGRSWTTDALFRETRRRVQRRVAEECEMVEMEAAALFAVADYRRVRFAHILYAGDMVANEEWDSRHWDSAHDFREMLFFAAVRAALDLHDKAPRR